MDVFLLLLVVVVVVLYIHVHTLLVSFFPVDLLEDQSDAVAGRNRIN